MSATRTLARLVGTMFILWGVTAFAVQPLEITSVNVNYDTSEILIYGVNFDNGGDLEINLSDIGQIASFSVTPTLIVASFPVAVLPAGNYLLTITSGGGLVRHDEMPITIGMDGPEGDQGPIGPQGDQGATGPQGPQGDQGLQGEPGSKGMMGLTGSDGATGPQGPQGLAGDTGPQGIQGEQGTQGLQGDRGLQGLAGPQGADSTVPGPQGIQGPIGLQGPQGPQGLTGSRGSTGGAGPLGPPGARGPAGPSSDVQPPISPVIGVAYFDGIDGDSRDQDYFRYFDIRALKFSVTTTHDYRTGISSGKPMFSDIEITINDQPEAITLVLKLLTGGVIPTVDIILLANPRTGGNDELLKLELQQVMITQAQPVFAIEPGDPGILKIRLNPTKIRLTQDLAESEYDFQQEFGNSCGLSDPLVLANAPGKGSNGIGMPISGLSIGFDAEVDQAGTGQTRTRKYVRLNDISVIAGLVPETACLFGGAFSPIDRAVRIENYDLPSDLTPSSEFFLEPARISAFSLETNSAGGVDVGVTFWYGQITITYDNGSREEIFDKADTRWFSVSP